MLEQRIRAHLCAAEHAVPVTYIALAKALGLAPPNVIQQLTAALETLIEEDAAAGRPLIAALVISKGRGGLPARGFFDCATRVGRFRAELSGPAEEAFYTAEFGSAVAYWRS